MTNLLILLIAASLILMTEGCGKPDKGAKEAQERYVMGGEIAEVEPLTDTDMDLHNMTKVRNMEVLKAYPLGRYIDPNDPSIMHEGHVIYRREIESTWNLNPNAPTAVAMGDTIAIAHPEHEPRMTAKEIESQYGYLRLMVDKLVEENQQLKEKLSQQEDRMEEINLTANQALKTQEKGKR